jgi:hypothetical protein
MHVPPSPKSIFLIEFLWSDVLALVVYALFISKYIIGIFENVKYIHIENSCVQLHMKNRLVI